MNKGVTQQVSQELSDVLTIIMPVRIDSEARKANVNATLHHICGLGCRIIILEADEKSILNDYFKKQPKECIRYEFVEDCNPIFHRTKYINMLLKENVSEIVAVWDADVLIDYSQVYEAVANIIEGCTISYPYNGEFVMLPENVSALTRHQFNMEQLKSLDIKPFLNRPFCGGVFLVHRQRYLKCGGENEHFTGWGPEDAERLRRTTILGHKVNWTQQGQAYHLYHPRGSNSDFHSEEAAIRLRKELVRICSMEKEELQKYVEGPLWNN